MLCLFTRAQTNFIYPRSDNPHDPCYWLSRHAYSYGL
nr:MAG TPA: hypothetical protein [Caudoviricetes sp.]